MSDNEANALPRSDLNRFLFADVGVEESGMTLSVLSTLARRGIDPWQEAGRLSKLPQSAAVDVLARIIAAMPASLWSLSDATIIARRLVALLPANHSGASAAPSQALQSARSAVTGGLVRHRWTIVTVIAGALTVGLLANMALAPRAPASNDVSGFSAGSHTSPTRK